MSTTETNVIRVILLLWLFGMTLYAAQHLGWVTRPAGEIVE